MYICRILLIQLLGCHIEINACLVLIECSKQYRFYMFCRDTKDLDELTTVQSTTGMMFYSCCCVILYLYSMFLMCTFCTFCNLFYRLLCGIYNVIKAAWCMRLVGRFVCFTARLFCTPNTNCHAVKCIQWLGSRCVMKKSTQAFSPPLP